MSNPANLAALQAVARALGPLRERVVFVGGSTAGLYSTVARAAESRPTVDVDCIIEVAPRMAYLYGPGGWCVGSRIKILGFFRHSAQINS